MKTKVSDLRYAKILPSAKLAAMSTHQYSGITISDKKFGTTPKWHEYEQHLDIHFDEGTSVPNDITKGYDTMCGDCNGACCKDIPTHNLRMYMSSSEIEQVCNHLDLPKESFIETSIRVDNTNFGIIKVKENSDCYFLREDGCQLLDYRPLWCKLWICEILQEKLGGIKNEYRSSQVSKE